jgi:hypothetical protein
VHSGDEPAAEGLAILRLMLSAAVLLGCFYYAGKAVWQAVMERP